MPKMDGWELLQEYLQTRSDGAFAELVHRHVNWMYSVALRSVRDPQLAEDVVQSVFALFVRKARKIRRGTILTGWLFRSTAFVAKSASRDERRQKSREHIASTMMAPSDDNEAERLWGHIAPHLERAVGALAATDRTAVLLRF